MLGKLRRWLLPPKPVVGDAYVAKMHNARAFGLEQRRASIAARRQMQRERAERLVRYQHGPIEDAIFPAKEDRA